MVPLYHIATGTRGIQNTVILEEPYMDIKIIRFPFKLHILQKEQYGAKFKSKKSNTTIQFWVRREP